MITLLTIPALKGTKLDAVKAILLTISLDALFISISQLA